MKVLVTGSFDMLHSGHITFLQQAAKFGDLYVGLGSDYSITKYKGKPPVCNQQERLFMVKSLRCVKDAWINSGEGPIDFTQELSKVNIYICNEDQHSKEKEELCKNLGIFYIVLKRETLPGLPARSTTKYRELCK